MENELFKKERAREGGRGRLTSITATVRPADVSPSRVAWTFLTGQPAFALFPMGLRPGRREGGREGGSEGLIARQKEEWKQKENQKPVEGRREEAKEGGREGRTYLHIQSA